MTNSPVTQPTSSHTAAAATNAASTTCAASPAAPPIIDLQQDEAVLVQQIREACARWGFFQVVNHDVDDEVRGDFEQAMRHFFALDRQEKLKCERDERNARGYVGREMTKQRWDHKECFDVGNCADWSVADDTSVNQIFQGLNGTNRFPRDEVLPDFKPKVQRYFHEMEHLSEKLGGLMALGMGGERDYFQRAMTNKHTSHLRMNYYPEEGKPVDGAVNAPFGVGPHTDSGFLTILAQDEKVHTLQVQDSLTGEWVGVPPVPGAFTINTGDLSVVFSNGLYHAPVHRVLTTTVERYSAPYFYNPSYATEISPIPALVTAVSPAQFHPLPWGYFRAMRVMGNFGDFGEYVKIDHWRVTETGEKPAHVLRAEEFTRSVDYEVPFDIAVYAQKLTQAAQPQQHREPPRPPQRVLQAC